MTVINPSSITGINSITSLTTTPIKFYDSSGNETLGDVSVTSINEGPLAGLKNLIINGDMRIDQRNAGAATSITGAGSQYILDRWAHGKLTTGAASVQRSAVAPVGFTSSLLVTTTTADTSLAATEYLTGPGQSIEGYNVAHLQWGTANAIPITVSFWVRSSLTGTFGVNVQNGVQDRSYVATFTINSANTWEYKSVTIPGDTSGTWYTDNRIGLLVGFSLGLGSNFQTTANTWSNGNLGTVSGAVSLLGTLNATWYVTGVQVEAGTLATPFERRPYGQELALCQRYYALYSTGGGGGAQAAGYYASVPFRVSMRATPTLTTTSNIAGTLTSFSNTTTDYTFTIHTSSSGATASTYAALFTASIEL